MTENQSSQSQIRKRFAGIRRLRVVLYVLILASAIAALALQPQIAKLVASHQLASGWLYLPMAVYGLFFVVFALDRWFLVRRARYPAGRAFFQVVFGLVFALILTPSTQREYQSNPEGIARWLNHNEAELRGLAIEALGYRGIRADRVQALALRLDDEDPKVRQLAAKVLGAWSGRGERDIKALKAWSRSMQSAEPAKETL